MFGAQEGEGMSRQERRTSKEQSTLVAVQRLSRQQILISRQERLRLKVRPLLLR